MTEPNFTKITFASAAVHFVFFTVLMLAVKMKPHELQKPVFVNLIEPGTKKAGSLAKKVSLPASSKGAESAKNNIPASQAAVQKQVTKQVTPKPIVKAVPKPSQSVAKPKEVLKPKEQPRPEVKQKAEAKPKEVLKPKEQARPEIKQKAEAQKPKEKEVPKPKEQPRPEVKQKAEAQKPKEQPKPQAQSTPKEQAKPKEQQTADKSKSQKQASSKAKADELAKEKEMALKKAQLIAQMSANKAKERPSGSPGKSPGSSNTDKGAQGTTGDQKAGAPGDAKALYIYSKKIERKIKDQWVYPDPSRTDLHNEVAIKIQKDGKVLQTKIEKSSGDAVFDQSTLKAVAKASPLPPPPPELVEALIKDEIVVRFNL
jgi:colicin import membrane protein